jgi:DNA-binding protein H-NS
MQTFEQIQQQILDLQKQADTMRKQAMTAAIKEVKRLVNLYSLGYADIGMTVGGSPAKKGAAAAKTKAAKSTKPAKAAKKASSDKRAAVAPKYKDNETGQTWTGRGKAPTWLAAKIAAGATKESFKI